ncbi:recombinase family protein [Metabacillus fastidiosus]|uniref:recombinase family protein n=1 Tax=Metabacillus fastidiosus TaxID=1458 RepID=UPI003D2DF446
MIILRGEERLSTEEVMNLVGKINGLIYARVSTTDQAKKGYSLESQIDKCTERAKSKFNINEDELIVLVEAGGMGDDPNRPALNYALHLLEKGLGKKFIVLHPDRLTRDNTLQGVISRKIWNLGVDIDFIEFEVDPNNPESMLMYNIQGSIAQYNKAKILANSKRGRIQKAKKGEISSFNRLYGYTFNKETDQLELNLDERDILLEMIHMLLVEKMSCTQIAKALSKRGIPAPSGKVWYQTTVARMLKNEAYLGTYYYGKSRVVQSNGKKKQVPVENREEWIPIKIPRIFDEVIHEKILLRIEELIKGAKGRSSRDYLLKGKARCGRCGGAAGSGITSKTKTGTYKYYSCRNKNVRGFTVETGEKYVNCKGKNWRVDIVDEVVWKWLKKRIEDPSNFLKEILDEMSDNKKINDLKQKQQQLQKEIKEKENEELNYVLLFGKAKINEEMFDTLVNPIKEQLSYLNQEFKIINNQIASVENNIDEFEEMKNNLSKYQTVIQNDALEMNKKREVLDLFVEKVILHEDDGVEIVWRWQDNDEDGHKKQDRVQAYGR